MIFALSSAAFWHFSVIAGMGAMIVFDLWCLLTRAMGIIIFDWGLLGRWLQGRFSGRKSVCTGCRVPHRARQKASPVHIFCMSGCGRSYQAQWIENSLGWLTHCALAVAVSALLPLIWGLDYLAHPTLAPALLVGFCLPSVIGQMYTLPAIIRAVARGQHKAPVQLHALMLVGNFIFAVTLFGVARDGVLLLHPALLQASI